MALILLMFGINSSRKHQIQKIYMEVVRLNTEQPMLFHVLIILHHTIHLIIVYISYYCIFKLVLGPLQYYCFILIKICMFFM